jgi:hypothetical protein
VVLISGIISFGLGYIMAECFINPKNKNCSINEKLKINWNFVLVCSLIGVIGFIFGVFQFINYGHRGPSTNFFINVRWMNTNGGGNSFFVKYSSIFLYISTCLYLIKYQNMKKTYSKFNRRKNLIIVVILASMLMISTLFTMARTSILQYFISIIYIIIFTQITHKTNKSFKTIVKENKKLIFAVTTLTILFIIFAQLTGKMGNNSVFNKEFFIYKYIGYSLISFDKYILNNPFVSKGYFVLGPIGKLLSVFGVYDIISIAKIGAPNTEFNV